LFDFLIFISFFYQRNLRVSYISLFIAMRGERTAEKDGGGRGVSGPGVRHRDVYQTGGRAACHHHHQTAVRGTGRGRLVLEGDDCLEMVIFSRKRAGYRRRGS